jgi:hypothetical protein
METQSESATAFLDVLVIREEMTLATTAYRWWKGWKPFTTRQMPTR